MVEFKLGFGIGFRPGFGPIFRFVLGLGFGQTLGSS